MRKVWLAPVCLVGLVALTGCDQGMHAQTARAIDSVGAIDQENMAEMMLAVADPREAVQYFTTASQANPDRVLFRRGLARSLMRAGRADEAVPIWREVVAHPEAVPDDRIELAEAYIRINDWPQAEATLNMVPPTYETYNRYRLEAMVADSRQQWDRADSFYEIASGLTANPAGVLNNWGYSKLTRGDNRGAEQLFAEALRHDPSLFTAKNNLVLARAAQRRYELPLIEMTQTERAELLHTMALAAIRQGDVQTGRALLEDAIATHPQHFESAANALAALR
ncbi:MAG: tetratricopeptide repeat protein [Rhodobacteraceae bacterium]|jgi:Tfp pilus assembly protein PilF|nr:tetratricopeptide repeat protein [Paracoccaceae bacterium]